MKRNDEYWLGLIIASIIAIPILVYFFPGNVIGLVIPIGVLIMASILLVASQLKK